MYRNLKHFNPALKLREFIMIPRFSHCGGILCLFLLVSKKIDGKELNGLRIMVKLR